MVKRFFLKRGTFSEYLLERAGRKKKRGTTFVALCRWKMGAAFAGREKTCGVCKMMPAARLTALDSNSSSGEKAAVWKAATRLVWTWKR